MAFATFFPIILVTAFSVASAQTLDQNFAFRFATVFGDHMVLQQAPHKAGLWGYTPGCQNVTVTFNGAKMDTTIVNFRGDTIVCKWKVSLPATIAGANVYTITATNQQQAQIELKDVLFGDVWICSGQSNMQFTVPQVYNASAEIAAAANYPMIRLFTAALMSSTSTVDELLSIEQNWTVASPESVGGKAWGFFSATCWFFGRDLFDKLKYPIGLVDSDWGGTPVEAWSSPDALAKCKKERKTSLPTQDKKWLEDLSPIFTNGYSRIFKPTRRSMLPIADPDPHTPSVLWNAMIYPLLNLTIKGAIWYQGEANAAAPESYNCTFPAMINDWREKWYAGTDGATDPKMGFGFVQLAANGNNNQSSTGFPDIRWAQTADYGYVPNDRLPNVFMAVAMDLGDPTSPFGSIHPRDKQDVGDRLSRAGLAVIYGDNSVYYKGPIATSATVMSSNAGVIRVVISYLSDYPLELRYPYGFEMQCYTQIDRQGSISWIEGTVKSVEGMDKAYIEFPKCPAGTTSVPAMIRYCWRTDPCTFKECPIYAKDLPSPPFVMKLN